MSAPGKVPSNVAVPTNIPPDILGVTNALTTFFTVISAWIARAANNINANDSWFLKETAPATPAAGQFVIYMDTADNKLKCKGPGGTVTILGNP